jgi:ribonuclease D
MQYLAIDIETINLPPYNGTIWMISICGADLKPKVYHDCNGLKKCPPEIRKQLEDKTICKVVHNGEFDLPYIELNWGVRIHNVWDTMVCEKDIQGVTADDRKVSEAFNIAHSASLKYTLARYGLPVPKKSIRENFINRKKGISFSKEEIDYAADDVRYLLPLRKAQEFLLTRDKQLEVALLDNKVIEKISRMRVLGVGVDKQRWLEVADTNANEYKRAISMLPKSV